MIYNILRSFKPPHSNWDGGNSDFPRVQRDNMYRYKYVSQLRSCDLHNIYANSETYL